MTAISSNVNGYGNYSLPQSLNDGATKKLPRSNTDRVSISKQAAQLERTYGKKKSSIEKNFASETKALEREYIQDKRQLELEFKRKKQSIGRVDIYV